MESIILQYLLLGIVQGIAEWLPISSGGALFLVQSVFFNVKSIESLIRTALFLHLGTFLAAFIYFRKKIYELIMAVFNYRKSDIETRRILRFLIISTIVTGIIGVFLLKVLLSLDNLSVLTGKILAFTIGFLLLLTAAVQFRAKKSKKVAFKTGFHLKKSDDVILGFMQGLAVLPGLSRSGVTSSTFLLRGFDKTEALKLSFLMSLPIVFIANIILNFSAFAFSLPLLMGLLSSFVFGLLTIHILIKVSYKIDFAWFVLFFAILTIASAIWFV